VHDSLTLQPEPRSAGAARRFVREHLRDQVSEDVAETATLLTSELVTNVIVHARTPMRLDLDVDPDAVPEVVRVAVVDEVPRQPSVRRAHDARLTGRGMNLVAELASQWGVEPAPPGKKVWFELPA